MQRRASCLVTSLLSSRQFKSEQFLPASHVSVCKMPQLLPRVMTVSSPLSRPLVLGVWVSPGRLVWGPRPAVSWWTITLSLWPLVALEGEPTEAGNGRSFCFFGCPGLKQRRSFPQAAPLYRSRCCLPAAHCWSTLFLRAELPWLLSSSVRCFTGWEEGSVSALVSSLPLREAGR